MALLHKMFAKPCFTGWDPFLFLTLMMLPSLASATASSSCVSLLTNFFINFFNVLLIFPSTAAVAAENSKMVRIRDKKQRKGLILFQTRMRDCINFLCADSTVIKLKAKSVQPSVITQNFHSSAFLLETRSELGLWFTSLWQQQQPHHEATSHRAQELLLFKDSSLSTEK